MVAGEGCGGQSLGVLISGIMGWDMALDLAMGNSEQETWV